MSDYAEFALRAPTIQKAITTAKTTLQDAGLDPYELEVLDTDPNGNDVLGRVVDAEAAGDWHSEDPDLDSDGFVIEGSGTVGDHAIINIRTKKEKLITFIEQFGKSDPAKASSEIPDSEKVGEGLHRVDESKLSSPEKSWFSL